MVWYLVGKSQVGYPQISDLEIDPPPARDIWWSLETCSNLFFWEPSPGRDIWWCNWNRSSSSFQAGGMHSTGMLSCYRPQRSCVQGYVFTRVCDSVHRGGLQAGRTPPGPGRALRDRQTPPRQADPPGKQTPEYGLRAAGTHPTGMHSCWKVKSPCGTTLDEPNIVLYFCETDFSKWWRSTQWLHFLQLLLCLVLEVRGKRMKLASSGLSWPFSLSLYSKLDRRKKIHLLVHVGHFMGYERYLQVYHNVMI